LPQLRITVPESRKALRIFWGTVPILAGEIVMRARVFVDFWNFQLGWNEATGKTSQCDWSKLPTVLVKAAGALLAGTATPPG
jgi:hypothetical protein